MQNAARKIPRQYERPTDRNTPLLAMLPAYGDVLRLGAGDDHVARSVTMLKRFLWGSRVVYARDLTETAIYGHLTRLDRNGRSPKTLRNELGKVSRFCAYLLGRGMVGENPCRGIRLKKLEQRVPNWLTKGEIAATLRAAQKAGCWAEVLLGLATGLRVGELGRLQWGDVNEEGRTLLVRKSKSGRPRVVPLSADALKALAVQRAKIGPRVASYVFPARVSHSGWGYEDRPLGPWGWNQKIRPVAEAVPGFRRGRKGTTGRGWHLLRHTFASRAVQRGVTLFKVGRWLGHSDTRTTQIYAHLGPGYDPEIEGDPLPEE